MLRYPENGREMRRYTKQQQRTSAVAIRHLRERQKPILAAILGALMGVLLLVLHSYLVGTIPGAARVLYWLVIPYSIVIAQVVCRVGGLVEKRFRYISCCLGLLVGLASNFMVFLILYTQLTGASSAELFAANGWITLVHESLGVFGVYGLFAVTGGALSGFAYGIKRFRNKDLLVMGRAIRLENGEREGFPGEWEQAPL